METKTLADKLKSVPTATSLSDLSTLCADSSGNLVKNPMTTTLDAEDLDTLTTPGVYRLNPQTLGTRPKATWEYGIVEVFRRINMTMQRIILYSGEMATRGCVKSSNPEWLAWKIFQYS